MINHKEIIDQGIFLESSGTTGNKKIIFQSSKKLRAAISISLQAQGITKDSKIYTVCKTSHAAGLLAQTLPALYIGAKVDCVPFNAYHFINDISNYTHTHITPLHAKAIMMTKGFKSLDLSNVVVVCGAEPIKWEIIESFVSQGCCFITNWGMTEIGPITIYHKFTNLDQVEVIKSLSPKESTIMGSNFCCDYKIVNDELFVKGEICVYDDWLATGDIVELHKDIMFFKGRKNKKVNFDQNFKF